MVREVDYLMKASSSVAVKELEKRCCFHFFFDRIFLKICFLLLECNICARERVGARGVIEREPG